MFAEIKNRYRNFLDTYGFQENIFLKLAEAVRNRELTIEKNRLPYPPVPLRANEVVHHRQLLRSPERERLREIGLKALRGGKVACLVLNGGMATRFGGSVKGLTEVSTKKTFIELKLADIKRRCEAYSARIPIVIMNSFQTERATMEFLEKNRNFDISETDLILFNQSISLRLRPSGEIFLDDSANPSFYAPGHGDFQEMLIRSGIWQRLYNASVRYLFFSNIDNLLARVDPLLIGHHLDRQVDYTCEVVENLHNDVGGSPVSIDNRLQIIEGLRFPDDFPASSIELLSTNTFIFTLKALDRPHPLKYYYVLKKVDDKPAVQLERITNELSAFLLGQIVLVDREGQNGRFIPIKTKDDLGAKSALISTILNYPIE